ncbi:hypothetical protein [Hymenobacter sp. DG25A]|uniref:hypothetical protein n=1 Tax=Hymenobacter sp. DG25A TaxID=1385663 RepID=UPI0012FCB915|nr:hypothetical protein [Hymenobacter sp. DG25A]
MTLSRRTASLLFGLLLLAAGAHAQTPLGQPTLDEQKVQIWCATVKFVYEDTGRPNLKNSLQCGSSLKAFENSIKADSQRVYSALYLPLEGRGAMYKGLGSDKSRIQKLATEIINRLKASPARRKDPARMQALDALATNLNTYVENGTPPGEVAAAEATADTTSLTNETNTASLDEVGVNEGETGAPAPRGGSESLMSKFFAPLALIVSLLSLFLYVLMRRSLNDFQKELSARIDKRREEIMALQGAPASGSAAPLTRLTPEMQRQVEQLVQQWVAQELGKRPAVGASIAPTGNDGQQKHGQNQNQNRPSVEKQRPAPAPSNPAKGNPAPAATPFANISQAPSAYEPPTAITETPAPPVVTPAGPPAAASRDEFDSLVPPVTLPEPPRPVAPGPELRYVKVPVNGGFSEYDLSDQPQHDSIYQITLSPQNPDMATFRVNPNPAVHAYAIQSAQFSLREACRYQQPAGPVSRIITDEDGTLRRVAGAWQIEHKAAIRFE